MAKIKKLGRTFQVREQFPDPYANKVWSLGDEVTEAELIASGWTPSDVDRAVNSLLVPFLIPKSPAPAEESIDDGKSVEEEDNG